MKLSVWINTHLRQLHKYLAWAGMVVVLAAVVMFIAESAFGQEGQDLPETEEQLGPVNQEQALERVRARFPGNVISINEVRQNGRVRYRVRIDNEGNIYTVFVDQATGAVSRE